MRIPQAVVFYTSDITFILTAEDVQMDGPVEVIPGPFFDLVNQVRGLLADYEDEQPEPEVGGFRG